MALNLRSILKGHPNIRLCPPASGPESDFGISQDDLVPAEDAQVVEGEEFALYDVQDPRHSGFTHFLDGAQRHWRAAYLGVLPIRLAHTSAALLERKERVLGAPTDQTYSGSLDCFVPDGDPDLLFKLREAGFKVRHISALEDESALAIQLKIQKKIEDRRKEHELELAARFTDGCLLVDGGIGEVLPLLVDGAFVVGLVKSHQKQYFKSAERHQIMLAMKAGQRTSVFLRKGTERQGKNAYSFYIKLRDGEYEPPMFGLARIEMPEESRYLEMADEIAGWVLHERCPLSLPDRRFDVLLYPIHLVEEHLKARQPSQSAIRGLIGL
ncbi:MAG: hypothetical protein ACAH95_01070 [Fimbriimonas sp.]